jgi:hypothetical protein
MRSAGSSLIGLLTTRWQVMSFRGAGSLRKVRWSRQGMGRRGGARVIYFNRLASGEVVLLLVCAKAKFDNLRPEFLLKLKERFHEQN